MKKLSNMMLLLVTILLLLNVNCADSDPLNLAPVDPDRVFSHVEALTNISGEYFKGSRASQTIAGKDINPGNLAAREYIKEKFTAYGLVDVEEQPIAEDEYFYKLGIKFLTNVNCNLGSCYPSRVPPEKVPDDKRETIISKLADLRNEAPNRIYQTVQEFIPVLELTLTAAELELPVGTENVKSIILKAAKDSYDIYHGANVVGKIRGSGVNSDKIILVGAHYDCASSSLPEEWGGQLSYGAIDNATGVATMLELAYYFSRPETRPQYTMIFVAFDGEEVGLSGSEYYYHQSILSGEIDQTVMMLNLDETYSNSLMTPHDNSAFGVDLQFTSIMAFVISAKKSTTSALKAAKEQINFVDRFIVPVPVDVATKASGLGDPNGEWFHSDINHWEAGNHNILLAWPWAISDVNMIYDVTLQGFDFPMDLQDHIKGVDSTILFNYDDPLINMIRDYIAEKQYHPKSVGIGIINKVILDFMCQMDQKSLKELLDPTPVEMLINEDVLDFFMSLLYGTDI